MELPLRAEYTGGQYITLKGTQNQEKLRLLGDFGVDTIERKNRELSRQGIQICVEQRDTHGERITDLISHEAFFLTSALGYLEIFDEKDQKLDVLTCWTRFREFNRKNNLRVDFALEYAAYFYFRTLGWVVKSGENYGVDFLLYDDQVNAGHSQYAVLVLEDRDCEIQTTWRQLITKHRVVQSVNKKFLIAIVKPNSQYFELPDCIKSMSIIVRSFVGNVAVHDL